MEQGDLGKSGNFDLFILYINFPGVFTPLPHPFKVAYNEF